MRKYDVAYVSNGVLNPPPPKSLESMNLQEIKHNYIRNCAKANGSVSVCEKCKAPCREGKRAMELVNNKFIPSDNPPLYGGKTMIERAKEENMKRREELQAKAKGEKAKKDYIRRDGWWEESLASGDQVAWVMTNLGLSRAKAKNRIYQYKWSHGMTGNKVTNVDTEKKVTNIAIDASIEAKLKELMDKQEMHRKTMAKYMDLYYEEKKKYEMYKEKIDVLCSAMDILNKEEP